MCIRDRTYTAGENEDTREWTVFAMDTDVCTYLYGFCALPDACLLYTSIVTRTEVLTMPKPKWNLNTIYISERLQESLRPISRCALTTVVLSLIHI